MTIIVSFAVRAEFAPWRRLESFERVGESSRPIYVTKIGGAEVYVLIGGIGTRGTASLRKLLEQRPDMCVVSGLAGSLKRNHAVGTVVVATTIKHDNPDGVMTSDDSLLELALQCGATRVDSFLTADAVVTSASDKLRLGAIADALPGLGPFGNRHATPPRVIRTRAPAARRRGVALTTSGSGSSDPTHPIPAT